MRLRTLGTTAVGIGALAAGLLVQVGASASTSDPTAAAIQHASPFSSAGLRSYDWAAIRQAQARAAGFTVVADHLNNPRGLTVTRNGDVYDAEAGAGGATCFGPNCIGFTGAVVRVHHGVALPVLSGLVSAAGRDGTFAVGSDDVAIGPDGSINVIETSLNLPNPPGLPRGATRQLGHLLRFTAADGLQPIANITGYEFGHDPDGQGKDSDPYAVLSLGNGSYAVADAAGNDVFEVAPDGTLSLLAVLPNNNVGAQAVPTSLAKGPDGAIYVGELGGEEHGGTPAGGARVWRIDQHSHALSEYRTNFTHISGLAFGPDGSLYVTELTRDPSFGNPAGDVVRVAPDGTRTRLGRSLMFPAGVAVDSAGHVYVNNLSILPANTQAGPPFFGMGGQLVMLDSAT
jgi:hypothetical protein